MFHAKRLFEDVCTEEMFYLAGNLGVVVRLVSKEILHQQKSMISREIFKLSKKRETHALKEKIKQLKDLEGKIKGLETQKEILKDQLDLQVRESNFAKTRVDTLEKEVKVLGKSSAVQVYLLLGTMCDEIQNMMFKRVFPHRFNPKIPRKIKHIEDMVKISGEKEKKSWAALKAELNWNYQHLDAVKSIKRTRNTYAHPTAKLTEDALRTSPQKMKEERYFDEGEWVSIEVVNELITMWKTLKEKTSSSVL